VCADATVFRTVLLRLFILASLAAIVSPASAKSPDDGKSPVILTIAGGIGASNRGALDPISDGILNYLNVAFSTAYEIERNALLALPQKEVRAQIPKTDKPSIFRGPRFMDVLELAKARNRPLKVMALDGFTVEFSLKTLSQFDWILAHERDGRALAIGGRGPLWLLHTPAGGVKASEDEEKTWVWSVFYIEVK